MAKEHYEYRDLDVVLTAEEVRAYEQQLPVVVGEYDSTEEEAKSIQRQYSSKLKGLRSTIQSVSQKIRDRSEKRNVRCYLRFDIENGKARVIREDTNVMVSTRDMTSQEKEAVRQTQMQFDEQVAQKMFESPPAEIED